MTVNIINYITSFLVFQGQLQRPVLNLLPLIIALWLIETKKGFEK